jgi:hypothetical protein
VSFLLWSKIHLQGGDAMKTSTAIGAGRAIMMITVPELRQRLYPIRGGMNEYVKSKSFGTDLRAERLSGTHGKRQGVPGHKPIQALKE